MSNNRAHRGEKVGRTDGKQLVVRSGFPDRGLVINNQVDKRTAEILQTAFSTLEYHGTGYESPELTVSKKYLGSLFQLLFPSVDTTQVQANNLTRFGAIHRSVAAFENAFVAIATNREHVSPQLRLILDIMSEVLTNARNGTSSFYGVDNNWIGKQQLTSRENYIFTLTGYSPMIKIPGSNAYFQALEPDASTAQNDYKQQLSKEPFVMHRNMLLDMEIARLEVFKKMRISVDPPCVLPEHPSKKLQALFEKMAGIYADTVIFLRSAKFSVPSYELPNDLYGKTTPARCNITNLAEFLRYMIEKKSLLFLPSEIGWIQLQGHDFVKTMPYPVHFIENFEPQLRAGFIERIMALQKSIQLLIPQLLKELNGSGEKPMTQAEIKELVVGSYAQWPYMLLMFYKEMILKPCGELVK